jgi:hypothetical protein
MRNGPSDSGPTGRPQPSSSNHASGEPVHHHDGHQHPDEDAATGHRGHGGHRLMMIACCIPMLVIVGILVATGVAGTGAIVFAAICLAVMAAMMFAMPGRHDH